MRQRRTNSTKAQKLRLTRGAGEKEEEKRKKGKGGAKKSAKTLIMMSRVHDVDPVTAIKMIMGSYPSWEASWEVSLRMLPDHKSKTGYRTVDRMVVLTRKVGYHEPSVSGPSRRGSGQLSSVQLKLQTSSEVAVRFFFDFAGQHPKQALEYCILDEVASMDQQFWRIWNV